MDQIPIKFLESVVQNISFGFPEISNSATEKIFSVLILVYLVNRLFTCLGRIIESEGMLEFYISFVEGIIYVFIFCYLTNSTWYFLPWVYILWFLGTIWCYIVYLLTPLFMSDSELNNGAEVFGPEDKDWLRNAKNNFEDNNK